MHCFAVPLMHLCPILFAVLLIAFAAGFGLFHAAGAAIQSLNDHPGLD
jgi:hypothetical protein